MSILDDLRLPVVLAPLAGGPSTPELAAAVASVGGLGFVAAGYLTSAELGERIRRTRSLTDGPIGVNLFVPGVGPAQAIAYEPFVKNLTAWSHERQLPVGEPRYSDDDWHAKIELLLRERVPVVSFTFGCPDTAVIRALQDQGSEVWVTFTSPDEAGQAAEAGADVLVAQGAEAGGHRASFVDRADLPLYALLPLLALAASRTSLPLVASGGIATGGALAAVLAAGARAAQIGTAFMLCPEAGTSDVHRQALRTATETGLTRAFTGRLARGIRNEFMAEHGASAPIAYPELHYVTAPLRQRGREEGNPELVNLWAGEAHSLARELPAAHVVSTLVAETEAALRAAAVGRRGSGRVAEDVFTALADRWYEAWNAHDLDRILSHYADDVVFSSPFTAALGFASSGTVVGKAALRSYWTHALDRFPELHFEPLGAYFGASSLTLHYRTVAGLTATEVMELGPDGLITRAAAHYDRVP
jgi:nitronate monooxygenase